MNDEKVKNNSKLKPCKACEKEIGKSVKVCPHCGTKQKGISKFGILCLIIGICWVSCEGIKGANKSQSTEEKKASVGESITSGDYEVTVTSANVRKSVGTAYGASYPSQGSYYLAVRVKLKNISNEPISSFSRPEIKFIDANGAEYSKDFKGTSTFTTEGSFDGKIISDLNPGVSTDLVGVFEVGSEALSKSGSKIIIEGDDDIVIQPKSETWPLEEQLFLHPTL